MFGVSQESAADAKVFRTAFQKRLGVAPKRKQKHSLRSSGHKSNQPYMEFSLLVGDVDIPVVHLGPWKRVGEPKEVRNSGRTPFARNSGERKTSSLLLCEEIWDQGLRRLAS